MYVYTVGGHVHVHVLSLPLGLWLFSSCRAAPPPWEGEEGGRREWQSSGWKEALSSSVEWTITEEVGYIHVVSSCGHIHAQCTCEKTDGMKPVAGICGGIVGRTVRE